VGKKPSALADGVATEICKEKTMLKRIIAIMLSGLSIFCATGAIAAEPAIGNPVILMETSLGNVKLELFAKEAPTSVKNFLSYVRSGFYDGIIFHRVIPGFMVQGGGFTPDLMQKQTGAPIKNEADNGLKNQTGTLAMARTAVVDSATAQFFINVADNVFLNHRDKTPQGCGYAVFGKVVEGMEVVNRIAAVRTGTRDGFQNVPKTSVVIKSMKVLP
jgi:cyclophilin family peptidyl-prolyl cis-trans isomerase